MGCESCSFNNFKKEANGNNNVSENNMLSCDKLNTTNWLKETPGNLHSDILEIRFKSTRKEFFKNTLNLKLKEGDFAVVDSSPGHDIGIISLTGILANVQFNKKFGYETNYQFREIYRKANLNDLGRWRQAKSLETPTLKRAKEIAKDLKLKMKLSLVEFQADSRKAIFYYIADERVDYRELIKLYAKEFNIVVEMKQIGARQEAGKIGGIGSCGRELCCSTWRTDFSSIRANVMKYQDLPPDIQKFTGLCGKLKCCLLYELDVYMEIIEEIPKELLELETRKGIAYHVKTDLLKKILWYTFEREDKTNPVPIPLQRVKEIINLNKRGIEVVDLVENNPEVNKKTERINYYM